MTENLSRKTAVELASLIATKAVSPVEVLDAHLATIARVNPRLNAIVTLVADGALVLAQQAEAAVMRGEKLGSLHGLPVAIKDVTATAGIRTTYGSPLFKDNVPSEDAEAVRRLKAAGAIVLGKTNTPEFAAGANTFNDVFGVTPQSLESGIEPCRFFRRIGSGGGDRHGAAGAGHGFWLLDPDAGVVLRHCRYPADAGADAELADATRLGSRPGARPTGAHGGRCRADVGCDHRLQPCIPDFGGAALGQRACDRRKGQRPERPAHRLRVRYRGYRRRAGDRRCLPENRDVAARRRRHGGGDRKSVV